MPLNPCTAEGVRRFLLQEDGLTLQNRECLFQSSDFGLASLDPVGVALWLSDAPLFNALQIREDSIEFLLHTRLVRLGLSNCLIETLRLFRLVFYILVLRCLRDLVLLGGLLIFSHGGFLGCDHLGKPLGEVRLAHFEKADNSTTSAVGRAMRLVVLRVILVQHFEGHLHTLNTFLHLSAVGIKGCLLLGSASQQYTPYVTLNSQHS